MKRCYGRLGAIGFFFALHTTAMLGQTPAATPNENPEGNTGALKGQVTTGASYDAHSGNGTRVVTDLHLPGALGVYGLDFTRYWNSLRNDTENAYAVTSPAFGASGWSHSWEWHVQEEDYSENIDPMDDQSEEIFTTAITITFPDGHANRYKITRSNRGHPPAPPDPRRGPPYTVPEQNGFLASGTVYDLLGDMAADGSEFWLYLADGGAVHFINGPSNYYATTVFDSHGLQTDLQYNGNGDLEHITQEGGRSLNISWGYRLGWSREVITHVESGGPAGVQSVNYDYALLPHPQDNSQSLVLTTVSYPDDRGPNQPVSTTYSYQDYNGDPTQGYYFTGPRLLVADDKRFAGPMHTIRYGYRDNQCAPWDHPQSDPPDAHLDYFYASGNSIAAEQSGDHTDPVSGQPVGVSGFTLGCWNGTRTEGSGLGGWRTFYFGHSAGYQGSGEHLGYQLIKLTDFTTANPPPGDLPFERQNWMHGQAHQVWDGRGIETDAIVTSGDGSGQPGEIHHVGSNDGSFQIFNRVNAGNSDAQDFTKVPNRYRHWLFSHTDERNLTTTYRRDSRRRVTDITHPDTNSEHFSYNDFNQVLTHTLPSGAMQHYDYDGSQRLLQQWNDVDGQANAVIYTYDGLEHVATVSFPWSRAAGANVGVTLTYNGRHKIIREEYPATSPGPNPYVEYVYDDYGNCIEIWNELRQKSSYEYDSYRRCTSYTEPLHASDWNCTPGVVVPDRTWNWLYDRWIDGIGQRDAYAHTKNEWRIQIEPAFNAAGDRRMTARAHDLQNRVIIESTGWIQPAGSIGNWYFSADGENHFFTYDANGQKSSFTDPQGRLTTYDYDLRNRLWKTNETVNTVPRTTETLYDVTGNKTMVTFPDTRTQQWLDYTPFGQAEGFIDERGNTTNLNHQWGPMNKLAGVITHRIRDDGGTENQPTTFTYDGIGRPLITVFPDASSEVSTYLFGQLKTWKTRKNQTKRVHYDVRGREDYHTWDNDAAPRIDRAWDDANRLGAISNIFSSIDFAYDDAGQLIWEGNEIAGSGGRTQTNYYRYPDGSVAHLHYPGGAFIRHDYTARGQLAATGWDDDEGNWWLKLAAYTYLADGKVDHIDYGNLTTATFGYDGRGMIGSVQHKRASGDVFASRIYTRDTRDRITSFQKGVNPGVNLMEDGHGDRFRYDEEGQLLEGWYNATDPANSGAGNTRYDGFAYDALGNRTQNNFVASRGPTSFIRRDNGLNQYSNWSPSVIYHDDNYPGWGPAGNGVMMAEGWITASYNALNQPVAIWSPAYQGTDVAYFGYDPLGRCVKRWVSDSGDVYSNPATYFHYDGWNLLQEGANAWGPARVYVHGNRVDEIVWSYNTFTGEQAFHHYDARGHCTLLTDSVGGILEQYEYDAFGQPYFYDTGANSTTYSPFGNRFLFTGREWLSDLKLYDYRSRMYQPELGRFLQPDPKEFAAGDYNLYRYCHNDPVNKSDPLGLDTYQQNRDFEFLGGGVSFTSNYNIATHSFTFTTHPDGSIKNTYSWGNTANQRGWNLNQREDRKAAEAAMASGHARKVGDSKLDPYIDKVFNDLNKKENEHRNLGVARNCKWEATDLLNKAKELKKQDDKAVEKLKNEKDK
jgi:RHS repeat-associated protein